MSFHNFLIQMIGFFLMRNPCIPNPCENGGTCQYTYSTGPHCFCESNFTGLHCSGIISFDSYFYAEVLKTGGDTVDHCSSSPCLNNGTCSATETSYKCVCPNGYTGQNCEASSTQGGRTVDHCSSAPCLNNGTCSATETSYTCVCEIGYTGENCQISGGETVDPCSPSPCLNNGTCSATETSYTCGCAFGYTGQNCETLMPHDSAQSLTIGGGHVDPCFSAPCLNSGTCLAATETSYTCSCPNGYTGQNCETSDMSLDPCFSRPCQNNGTCSQDGGDYKCQCVTGFTGRDCETRSTVDPCGDHPCHNGGRCYPDEFDASDYNCVCPIKFIGKNCDIYLA